MFKRVIAGIFVSLFFLSSIAGAGASALSITSANGGYVALGDSVAAGQGLPPNGTNVGASAQCGRSDQAYPNIVAARLSTDLVSAACSGATAGDLLTSQDRVGSDIPAQLDTAFAHGTPALMSITAGANDAHWAGFLQKCYTQTCGTQSDNWRVQMYLASLRLKLHFALAHIALRSGSTPPTVVVTGYYNSLSGQCAADEHLTADELTWLSGEVQALNDALRQIVSLHSFASFAPVDFTGHDLCSGQSWVQGLSDPAPFHPTAAGQAAIARAVVGVLQPQL